MVLLHFIRKQHLCKLWLRVNKQLPIILMTELTDTYTSGRMTVKWNCEILILINFIIGEVYFYVCCMISCYYISDNPLVVEILKYFNSKATCWCPSFCSNGDIPFWMAACLLFYCTLYENSTCVNYGFVWISSDLSSWWRSWLTLTRQAEWQLNGIMKMEGQVYFTEDSTFIKWLFQSTHEKET